MKQTEHTPGPWLRSGLTIYTLRNSKWAGLDTFENAWSATVQPDGKHKTSIDELEANARLIAAAPDLLAALDHGVEAAQAVIGAWERGDLAGAVYWLQQWAEGEAIQAIAKARGES